MVVFKNLALWKKSKNKKIFLSLNLLVLFLLSTVLSSLLVKAIDIPTLLTPPDNSIINDNTPKATWTTVAGATKYNIQVDVVINFDPPIINDENVLVSSYTISSPAPDGEYFWRVRAYDGSYTDWSTVWSFIIDTVPPGAPSLVSPSDNIIFNDATPYLDWNSVSDAYRYNIQIDDNIDMASPFLDVTPATTATNYQVSTLADGSYHWRVRARDIAGNWGAWSTRWDFNIDTVPPGTSNLISPSNGALLTSKTVNMVWSTATDGYLYTWQISDTATFDTVWYSTGLTGTSDSQGVVIDGLFYWRVRAQDWAGNPGSWSTVWSFTIDSTGPIGPSLLTPANGAILNDGSITFDWNVAGDADDYQIQVDDSIDFLSPEIDVITVPTQYDGNLITDDVYYWRVRGRDPYLNWGSWSTTRNFELDTTPPDAPTLVTPNNDLITSDNETYFGWDYVSDGVEYQLQVDTSISFSSPVVDTLTVTNEYTHVSTFVDGTYYWRVRARDAPGNWGSWSVSRTFTIDTTGPDAPSLVAPSQGELITDNTPLMIWNPSTNAIEYEIIIDDDLDFLTPEVTTTTANTFYSVVSILSDNTYYWKVRAKDSLDNWGSWCAIQLFSIDTVGPNAPNLSNPPDGTITNDNTPSFEWNSVSGGVQYK